MFKTIKDFEEAWTRETANTQKMMDALNDQSLSQPVADDHRTLGRVAWHILATYPEMTKYVGLKLESVKEDAAVPASAEEIKKTYKTAVGEILNQIKAGWTDETLLVEDELYGEKWARGITLDILIRHEIHHRGQMTILMRQAGLKVPGIYGPALEEWGAYGMEAPKV